MVLKDLAKSAGFFLSGVPKYLLTATFFVLPSRKGLVYHQLFLTYCSETTTIY